MSTTEIQTLPTAAIEISREPVAQMLQAIIEKGVTQESVAVVERLVGLYEKMQERDAEKAFAQAFVSLQADMPAIEATKAVPGSNGTVRYKFAPYEDIMRQAQPFLRKHGFTVTFSMEVNADRVTQTCILQHVGGYSRRNSFAVRIGKGPPGSNEAQADGAASTYAKRFAFCNALNIVCEVDSDARNIGEPISWEQVEFLREQVKETRSDEASFLRFAGAKTYEEIGSARYDSLVQALQKKARG